MRSLWDSSSVVEEDDRGRFGFDGKDIFSDEWEDEAPIEPYVDSQFEHGEFKLVGHGEVTNAKCGQFSGYHMGCDHVDLHDKTTLDGVNHAGKVHIARPIIHTCDKPSCPTCFKDGWARRQARTALAHLKEASKHYGLPEHIIATFPERDWELPIEELRAIARKAMMDRGIIGGISIFHGFRFHKKLRYWHWGVHFHCVGFVLGGMRRCRRCPKPYGKINCVGCDGFWARTFKVYEKDGIIVKIKGKRKSVGGTLWYLLNHATVKKGSTRFRVATYFGVLHKMKVAVELRKSFCPICQSELVRLRYVGSLIDPFFLLYGRNFDADYMEQPEMKIFVPEVAWVRVVSSVSYGYCDEELV